MLTMLVNLKKIMDGAEKGAYAVGAFNTPNLESVMAVIQAAENLKTPVIIQHAEVHEKVIPIADIGPIMIEFAKRAKVPVCVQLDHGESWDYILKALRLGFTAIMFDGSSLPFEKNVEETKKYAKLAHAFDASIEGELGSMGRRNTIYKDAKDNDQLNKTYTNPVQAKEFVNLTGIDALACSFGTTHGFYVSEPNLRMDIVADVHRMAEVPVVMHGGSGVSPEDFRKSIENGVRKINYYTYMAKAGADYVEKQLKHVTTPIYFHEISNWGREAIVKDVEHAICIFSEKLILERRKGN